jgi:hypothetical protein
MSSECGREPNRCFPQDRRRPQGRLVVEAEGEAGGLLGAAQGHVVRVSWWNGAARRPMVTGS